MEIKTRYDLNYSASRNTELRNKLLRKYSVAESHFADMLASAGIFFDREKANFRMGDRWCYYDFYLPYYALYIEIDGKEHQTDEQKAIDREKELQAMRHERFIVRFTNEQVMAMESIDIHSVLEECFVQSVVLRKTGRKRRTPEHYREVYNKIMMLKREKATESIIKTANQPVDTDRRVWMYDNLSGVYFCFANILDAKFSTDLTVNDIFKMLDMETYKRSSTRRYVFAYTRELCETRVLQTF